MIRKRDISGRDLSRASEREGDRGVKTSFAFSQHDRCRPAAEENAGARGDKKGIAIAIARKKRGNAELMVCSVPREKKGKG